MCLARVDKVFRLESGEYDCRGFIADITLPWSARSLI